MKSITNPPNLIFLDFDGVLNSELFYKNRSKELNKRGRRDELDRNTIKLLNEFLKRVNGKVVVSSTYRKGCTIQELTDLLGYFGFDGEIIDKTPVLGRFCVRGNEILEWIKDNKSLVGPYYEYKNYVIFDDDSDMLYWQRNNFIHVDPYVGLTPRDFFIAEKILQSAINPIEWKV